MGLLDMPSWDQQQSPIGIALRALLGLPQQAQDAADWMYRSATPTMNRANEVVNYYAGPHLSRAMGNITQLGGLLSPAGGGQDALAGSAETSRGLLGGDLAQSLLGGGEMGLGLLGMVPGMGLGIKAANKGLNFAGSTTPAIKGLGAKAAKMADFSDTPLTKLQQALARELRAAKVGEGKAYNEYGRRVESGDKSKYYKLPDGRELRISSHSDVNAGKSHLDLVIDPFSGEASLTFNSMRGLDGTKGRTVEFARDDPKTTLNIAGEPIPDWHGFEGDGAAWTAAIRKYLRGE